MIFYRLLGRKIELSNNARGHPIACILPLDCLTSDFWIWGYPHCFLIPHLPEMKSVCVPENPPIHTHTHTRAHTHTHTHTRVFMYTDTSMHTETHTHTHTHMLVIPPNRGRYAIGDGTLWCTTCNRGRFVYEYDSSLITGDVTGAHKFSSFVNVLYIRFAIDCTNSQGGDRHPHFNNVPGLIVKCHTYVPGWRWLQTHTHTLWHTHTQPHTYNGYRSLSTHTTW